MKISELIKELQRFIVDDPDVEVRDVFSNLKMNFRIERDGPLVTISVFDFEDAEDRD